MTRTMRDDNRFRLSRAITLDTRCSWCKQPFVDGQETVWDGFLAYTYCRPCWDEQYGSHYEVRHGTR